MASGLEHPGNCPRAATSTSTSISEADAKTLTDRFNGIRDHSGSDLGDWRKTAERIFADEFRVHSNSYLALKGRSLDDGVGSASKQGTIDLIGKTLDFVDVKTVGLIVPGGDTLVQTWEAKVGEQVVRGIGIIEVAKGGDLWQIKKWSTEFDNLSYRTGLDT
ncbi:hypothetical protein CLAFUW4_09789 [Fulvia fulva]|uniref:NTF2-like domain-containing protein n=1 Tax=Passalora fulva TaxID=5499 RepID=A0A9Q8PHD0_PASFU|nr:uncharacterized protein CLAFUR5_12449 [Fulvia fulva]KAK4615393.1 hypothetical protein CLAFUR4_09794 [Fulvia fulva]KAK4616924.1 hypothetical protein CLAFUR0_09787 [Fulvia fulva]UJO22536.1 hypothetical protein CLAFUR5_12449 [Fulvia fulva]WPV19635.1 hypothetical protein CLAFUW4_09789 [Fulvia fulva]WPV34395.1 hypothetical protein CLAFUW7_09792 [Fulvia fulva]